MEGLEEEEVICLQESQQDAADDLLPDNDNDEGWVNEVSMLSDEERSELK